MCVSWLTGKESANDVNARSICTSFLDRDRQQPTRQMERERASHGMAWKRDANNKKNYLTSTSIEMQLILHSEMRFMCSCALSVCFDHDEATHKKNERLNGPKLWITNKRCLIRSVCVLTIPEASCALCTSTSLRFSLWLCVCVNNLPCRLFCVAVCELITSRLAAASNHHIQTITSVIMVFGCSYTESV